MNEELKKSLDLADGGEWDAAHRIVQQHEDRLSCWLHANLHREEGDLNNAGYWYSRVGMEPRKGPIAEERIEIRAALQE